ncbi:hypothetical protein MUY14_39140 [Amycolatopsis sp. FBCC-B4732]|uniref:hypothetical protein n=1 Tax=Amycolatopsis sp. FBCC-B4732 TaxID=3079339 RepID=UPI001FF5B384|nr:hypothetical protein [Amycolatopsis sp. FBCC-B4732]UOX87674.1 hypothetical protein MUY14_39140 [Amycolatopsis sp. FBCC-B4732]
MGAVARVRTVLDFGKRDFRFVDVLDCTELPPKRGVDDPGGAILLTVNGVVLLDEDLYSSIELLWIFVAQLVADYRQDGRAVMSFPDQSIEISLDPVPGKQLRITVAGGELRRTSVAGEEELLSAITVGGVEFFEKLAELTGRNFSAAIRRLTGT